MSIADQLDAAAGQKRAQAEQPQPRKARGNGRGDPSGAAAYLSLELDQTRAAFINAPCDRLRDEYLQSALQICQPEKIDVELLNTASEIDHESMESLQQRLQELCTLKTATTKHPAQPSAPRKAEDREPPHLTETGNALRFVRLHGENVRYVPQWRKWIIWTGDRWQEDTERRIVHLARDVARQLHAEAMALPMRDETKAAREALTRWAFQSERRQITENFLALAATDPAVVITPEKLDADPWRLGVRNGILNLKNGELEQPDREALILKQMNVAFDETASCPLWLDFIEKATDGDKDLQKFLQVIAGYVLTVSIIEKCFFLIVGPAGTGKTTFTETLQHLLGDYGLEVDPQTLMEVARHQQRAGHQAAPDIARLRGVRLAVAAETKRGARLNEGIIKHLTGGDKITARGLYEKDSTDFMPSCKVFIYSNHLPRITDGDDAIWDRVRRIPFLHPFKGAGEDKHFREHLKEQELPGILNWMIEGCLTWQREGLPTPDKVASATAAYRQDQDQFLRFLTDCTETKKGASVEAGKLYKSYRDWTEQQGEMSVAQKRFSTALVEKGFQKIRSKHGNAYLGLELVHDEDDA